MNKKNKDDYVVLFSGAKLSKHTANRVGLGIIFGVIGFIIAVSIVGLNNRLIAIGVGLVCTFIGYFLGDKIFKGYTK